MAEPALFALTQQVSTPIVKQKQNQRNDSVFSDMNIAQATTFDAQKHLAFKTEPKVTMMTEIGFAEDTGVSPVAVTEPFPLFSPEAIEVMRSEIFKPEVLKDYRYSSNIAQTQLRGYARDHAPFTFAAWNHPDTLAIVSKLAGVDLIPWSDYEVAHINLSSKTEEQVKQERECIEQQAACDKDDKPIVGWHTDSYPFVCVLMMSDCDGMIGGETALRTGDGRVLRIRGPTEGCAVILQGRYITHQALRALGAKERITAVTSFRPRSSLVKDDSVLRTVRPVSDLNELYYDFAEYRLQILEERIRRSREEMHLNRQNGLRMNTAGHQAFLAECVAFMKHTAKELVAEDKVSKGHIEEVDLPNVEIA